MKVYKHTVYLDEHGQKLFVPGYAPESGRGMCSEEEARSVLIWEIASDLIAEPNDPTAECLDRLRQLCQAPSDVPLILEFVKRTLAANVQDLADAIRQRDSQMEECDRLGRENDSLKEDFIALDSRWQSLNKEAECYQRRIVEFEGELLDAQTELDEKKKLIASLEQELCEKKEEIRCLDAQITHMQENL